MQLHAKKVDPRRPTVLCIGTDQFSRDITELENRGEHYNWVVMPDLELIKQQLWMPERLRYQAIYVNETGPDVDEAWAKARQLGVGMLTKLKAKVLPNLVAVVGSNWDYWNEECMRIACREVGVPFLVLLREHVIAEDWSEETALYGSCQFIPKVDGVAIAGESTRHVIAKLKLQPDSIIRNTGLPRFDIWRDPVEPAFDRPVVLLSYKKGYGADEHFKEMVQRFIAAARRHPAVPFILKAKHETEAGFINAELSGTPDNFKCLDSASFPSVVVNARAVIGFRSLSLYETLLAGVPIMVPSWGEAAMNPALLAPSPADSRLAGFMDFYADPAAFDAALDQAVFHPRPAVDLAPHRALFSQYFRYDLAESATSRVEQFVKEFTGADRPRISL